MGSNAQLIRIRSSLHIRFIAPSTKLPIRIILEYTQGSCHSPWMIWSHNHALIPWASASIWLTLSLAVIRAPVHFGAEPSSFKSKHRKEPLLWRNDTQAWIPVSYHVQVYERGKGFQLVIFAPPRKQLLPSRTSHPAAHILCMETLHGKQYFLIFLQLNRKKI